MAPTRAELAAALDACELACAGDAAVGLRATALRALTEGGVAPRVAAVGRRGAGKSALLNALAGAPLARTGDVADTTIRARAWGFDGPHGRFVWLDAPGFRAGGRAGRLVDVAEAVRAFGPSVVALCVAATEVDAAIDGDLDDLARVAEVTDAPLVALATRVDELEPPDVALPPFDDADKQRHIAASVATLAGHLAARKVEAPVLPVCALADWRDGSLAHDARWNLDAVAAALRAPPHGDLDALVRGLGELIIAHHASRAEALAREALPRVGELLEANGRAMLDALDALLGAWCGRAGPPLRAVHARALRGGGAVRAALELVGASRASGAAAARRVRSLGAEAMEGARVGEAARAALGQSATS